MKMALSSQLQGKEWQQPENLAEARDRPPPGPEGAWPGRHLALGPERRPLDSRPEGEEMCAFETAKRVAVCFTSAGGRRVPGHLRLLPS